MFAKLKNIIVDMHHSLLPKELSDSKRKRTLFYVSFYFLFASTFLTVLSQLPMFTSRGLTQIFQVGWIIFFIPILMLDYRQVLRYLAFSIILVSPFILYCLISLIFGINAFKYGGTTYVFLCLFLFIIFGVFSKYKNRQTTKLICVSFLVAAVLYAGVVFLTKLKGQDISNQIYAFGDKNSAGPIFMCASILGFYVFNKRNVLQMILKWGIFAFFVIIIALSKTRSVLIVIPIIMFVFLFKDINNAKISFSVLLGFLLVVILIFAVPFLREKIIVNIFLNGKTDIDSIFSGRLTQIVVNMQNFKPVLGTGGSYFDCMILSLLCSYGVIGFLLLLPFLILPFFMLFAYKRKRNDIVLKTTITALIIVFIASSLLEGFGYIGTGAKVFIFWFFVGNFSFDVFYQLKEKPLLKPINKINYFVDKTPKNVVMFTISSLLFVLSLLTISVSSISLSIGKTVVDKLPSSNVIADYIEIKDIQIDPPVETMCVGQRIKYGLKADPVNAEDITAFWSTGWISDPCISVDGYTGVVTANRTGKALLHINRFRVGPNGTYIQYPVIEASKYIFDKFYISQSKYHCSFEHNLDEQVVLNAGCTSKIYYDEFYLPNNINFEYVSSNEDIAIIQNNLIKAKTNGVCEIYAIVHNDNGDIKSANKIQVTVNEGDFKPVTQMDLELPEMIYQNQEYELSPAFNDDASDKNFSIEITGQNYLQEANKIKFSSFGNATITIISNSNTTIKHSYSINVLENAPDHFECLTKRMLIGETKNASQLGLSLVFKNGYKKIITEDDLLFNPFDFTNRAWSDQNGLVKNRTTVKAVKTGNIKLSFVSKTDPEVTGSFTIISSVYTEKEYNALSRGIGTIAVTFVLLLALLFSLFVPFKKKWITCVLDGVICILFLTISALLYGFTNWFIASSVMAVVGLSAVIILCCVLKNRIPFKFLETPVEIEYKKMIVEQSNNQVIEINI